MPGSSSVASAGSAAWYASISGDQTLTDTSRAIMCQGGTTLSVLMLDGTTLSMTIVTGYDYKLQATKIFDANTDATNILVYF